MKAYRIAALALIAASAAGINAYAQSKSPTRTREQARTEVMQATVNILKSQGSQLTDFSHSTPLVTSTLSVTQ